MSRYQDIGNWLVQLLLLISLNPFSTDPTVPNDTWTKGDPMEIEVVPDPAQPPDDPTTEGDPMEIEVVVDP